MMARLKRPAKVAIAVTAALLVVVAGLAGAWAAGLLGPRGPQYVTAEVTRGTVRESVTFSGSVTRVNQATATFPASGTVTWLGVEVGDTVKKGQKLARIEKLPLQVALVKAQAELTQAQAQYAADLKAVDDAAKAKAAGSGDTGSSGTGTSGGSASGTSGGSTSGTSGGSTSDKSGKSGGSTSGTSGMSADKMLAKMIKQMQTATKAATLACAPLMEPPPVPTGAPTTSSPPDPAASTTPATSEPSAPAGPDPAQVKACVAALTKAMGAQTATAGVLSQMSTQLTKATRQLSKAAEAQATAMAEAAEAQAEAMAEAAEAQAEAMAAAQAEALAQLASGGEGMGAGMGSGSMKAALAQDLVAITRAQQGVNQARSNLAKATMKAPIDGVVGSVAFTEGEMATPYSGITIVGSGASEVTVPVPLSKMGQVSVGQAAEVFAPGSTEPLAGEVTALSPLPTSTGSGPSYPAVISVTSSPQALTSGVTATVRIAVRESADVLTAPLSAVVPTDDTHANVVVVTGDGTLEEVNVTTGARGGSRIEIVSGLSEGQRVLIGDPSKPLPGIDIFGGGPEGSSSGGGSEAPQEGSGSAPPEEAKPSSQPS